MSAPSCRFETLASEGAFAVQRCVDCGGVTLHVGCVSVRLDVHAFLAAHDVISRAARLVGSPRAAGPRSVGGAA